MCMELSIEKLLENGDVLTNVAGSTVEEVYKNVCKKIRLPEGLSGDVLCNELLEREKILSTAVGQGISIPHPRYPLLKAAENQRIIVCFLKDSMNMNAPDSRRVFVMFILLSNSSQNHIKALSSLAKLLHHKQFLDFLQSVPDKMELLKAVEKFSLPSSDVLED